MLYCVLSVLHCKGMSNYNLIECVWYGIQNHNVNLFSVQYKVVIAQWLALQFATGEVPGSNPGLGKNLLISD